MLRAGRTPAAGGLPFPAFGPSMATRPCPSPGNFSRLPAPQDTTIYVRPGYNRVLAEEFEALKVKRVGLVKDKVEAHSQGDLRENSGFNAAKEAIRAVDRKMAALAANAMVLAVDEKARATDDAEETKSWERHLETEIRSNDTIPDTTRRALVQTRRGQGLFRERVAQIERCSRVTRVELPTHLRASHCKPWRDADNQERLDGENGLFLTPTVDHLFDRGFISFEDSGRLLISPVVHRDSLERMGIRNERAP